MFLISIDGKAYNSGQRLNNVKRTHLVLAIGKLLIHTVSGVIFWRLWALAEHSLLTESMFGQVPILSLERDLFRNVLLPYSSKTRTRPYPQ